MLQIAICTTYLLKINKKLHNGNKVRDTDRSLFFSGIMIALTNTNFRKTYKDIQAPTKGRTPRTQSHYLNEAILSSIEMQLKNKINNNLSKEIEWKDSFSFIKTIDFSLDEYKELILLIENEIFIPFKNDEKQDILGKAYKIFLHRSGKIDNKNIILTPDHIKSFMIELARLSIDDVVIDTCTGTGGFLMEAMEILVDLVKNDTKKIKQIKEKQLIGFEVDRVLFALACSNMFLHGDGKSNLFFRSSLIDDSNQHLVQVRDNQLLRKIRSLKPTKCIINPPYENNNPIKFTKQALEYLEPNGKLIIIMPRTTLQNNIQATQEILENAKLDFIIKMPENLFREQSRTVNTAIFGFTKTRHQNNDKTIFYTLKDDGLVSIQHKGRVDKFNKWSGIKNDILNVILSMPKKYQKRILDDDRNIDLVGFKESKDKTIMLGDIFDFKKGSLASENNTKGKYTFITASEEYKTHNVSTHNCEALIYAVSASGSLGRCHYFNGEFIASNLCVILTPKENVEVEMKFYAKYLNSLREQIVDELADGTSKLTIDIEALKRYKIKSISIEKQKEIMKEIDKNQKAILKKQQEIDELNEKIKTQFDNLI
ncbi:MAG: N-6 DNA methylase [Campylobacter sp.]|nr:N-6 DNA methylase [Campylobacter sp.]